jgi:hypothetical protein
MGDTQRSVDASGAPCEVTTMQAVPTGGHEWNRDQARMAGAPRAEEREV